MKEGMFNSTQSCFKVLGSHTVFSCSYSICKMDVTTVLIQKSILRLELVTLQELSLIERGKMHQGLLK